MSTETKTSTSMTRTSLSRRLIAMYDVADAEPVRAGYSERMFLPRLLKIEDNSGWVRAYVIGNQIRKDGTPGANRCERSFGDHDLAKAPQWVRDAVEAHRSEYTTETEATR